MMLRPRLALLSFVLLASSVGALVACSGSEGAAPTPPGGSDGGAITAPEDGGAPSSADASSDGSSSDGSSSAPDGGSEAGAPGCLATPFPTACDVSATTMPPAGYGTTGPYTVDVASLANPHPSAPLPMRIYTPHGQTSVPVLFFSHAFGATDADSYDGMFRQLASNGYAVVFVPYPILVPALQMKDKDRYDCIWDGFVEAVAKNQGTFDLTRVGFFGHSYGGGATPEMARRGFVEKGWGSAGRFVYIMAPWYSWGSGYDTIPTDVHLVVQVYADDEINDHQIAVEDIWKKLPAGIDKHWLMVRSDVCGCGLNATHTVPMTQATAKPNPENVTNAHDAWGVWRRIHALAAYTFEGTVAAKPVAYGTASSMGSWIGCGGRAVAPIEGDTSPITDACHPYKYPLADRCQYADPGVCQ